MCRAKREKKSKVMPRIARAVVLPKTATTQSSLSRRRWRVSGGDEPGSECVESEEFMECLAKRT